MLDFDDLDEAEDAGEATTEEQQEARAAKAAEESAKAAEERRLAAEQAARRAEEEAQRQHGEAEEAEAEAEAARKREEKAREVDAERYWRVVHSADAGGLVVQKSEDKSSQVVGRLEIGTVVVETERSGNRLRFRWEAGNPTSASSGWVSIKGAGPWGKEFLKCIGSYEDWQAKEQQAPAQLTVAVEASVQEALFLLDWDDTLCPTTFLKEHADTLEESPDSPAWKQLEEQAQAALEFLRKASSLGTLAVVTLADRAWVEAACREYLPAIAHEVAALDVFYAGEQNVAQLRAGANLDLCTLQKKRAMEKALGTLSERLGPKTIWRNLVSIGDSEAERSAAKDLGRESKATGQVTWTKTVKLAEHPDLSQLTAELRQLERLLPELLEHKGSRTLELTGASAVE